MLKITLTYLGILPFLAFLLLDWMGVAIGQYENHQLFVLYSLMILNFVLGTLWHNCQQFLALPVSLWTNVLSILSFMALFLPLSFMLLVMAAIYGIAIVLEYASSVGKKVRNEAAYRSTRVVVSSLVITLHFIALMRF